MLARVACGVQNASAIKHCVRALVCECAREPVLRARAHLLGRGLCRPCPPCQALRTRLRAAQGRLQGHTMQGRAPDRVIIHTHTGLRAMRARGAGAKPIPALLVVCPKAIQASP